MIYTVTLNPAVDYLMYFNTINKGFVNRSDREKLYIGGKGINVSLVLNELGIKSRALGFIGGFTGTIIENKLFECGIENNFVKLETGMTRINVKLKSNEETDLNANGPNITGEDIERFLTTLSPLEDGDTIILSGSIPSTVPDNIYEMIVESLNNKKIKIIADTTGNTLLNLLKYKPFLIKPNVNELEDIFKTSINGIEEIVFYAKKLKNMGAVNVLVSRAGDGAVLLDENNKIYTIGCAKGKVLNSVSAGDSMVAGFIAGIIIKHNYEYALKLATACGGATAFSEWIGKKELIYKLLKSL